MTTKKSWYIYTGSRQPSNQPFALPEAPNWRNFKRSAGKRRLGGQTYQAGEDEIRMVNAALYLRRPLLVTGAPGIGKSSIADAVALELGLGEVLRWNINTRSTLKEGLYQYDAIGRLQDASLQEVKEPPDIGDYITLGPLGTAMLPQAKPRVLLIDEIDKSDIDLPNDLLHIFENGEFTIPELIRIKHRQETVKVRPFDQDEREAPVSRGRVQCEAFPLVIMTSNGEREFPPAFKRRCLQLALKPPTEERLLDIIHSHLIEKNSSSEQTKQVQKACATIIEEFLKRRNGGILATDQLLNAIFIRLGVEAANDSSEKKQELLESLTKVLLTPLDAGSP